MLFSLVILVIIIPSSIHNMDSLQVRFQVLVF